MNKQFFIAVLGWCLSLVILASVFFIVPLRDVWHSLLLINPLLVIPGMILVVIHLYVRSIRWALLFLPHFRITGKAASMPVMVSLAINAVLPGKIGELVRIALAVRQFKTGWSFTTVTLIGDRLLDSLTLLFFLNIALLLLPDITHQASAAIFGYKVNIKVLFHLIKAISLTTLIMAIFIILLIYSKIGVLLSIFIKSLPLIGDKLGPLFDKIISEAIQGLTALKSYQILFKTVILSIVIWLLLALVTQLVSLGIAGIELNFLHAFVVTAMCIAFASIPSAPGGWGVFEAGGLLALKLLDIPSEIEMSVAFVLILHLNLYLPVVLMGVIMIFKNRIGISVLNSLIHSSVPQQSVKGKHKVEKKTDVFS